MIAGATYTLPVTIPYEIEKANRVLVTLKNESTGIMRIKHYPHETETWLMPDGRLGVRLSQQDTIDLVGYVKVEAQINLASGAVAKTETKRVFVSPTLHTEMVEGATDNGEVYLEDVVLEIDAPITENANGGGDFSIDKTMTVEGAAADAKAVGDRFAAQQEQIDHKQPIGDYALKNEIPVQSVNGKTGAVQLKAADVGADAAGTADSRVGEHNVSEDAHNDIRLLISGLSSRLNALANSTDEDLDQLAEIVAYIKANKTLIDSITTSKVSVADIIDNLTTSVSNKPLSAKMGVELKKLIDAIKIPTTLPASDVYDWAKQPQKPTYTAGEVGAASAEKVTELSEAIVTEISNNLFDGHSWTYGVDINTSGGHEIESTSTAVSDMIPVSPATEYTLKINDTGVAKRLYAFYFDADETYITSIGRVSIDDTLTLNTAFSFTTPDDSSIAYMRFRWQTASLTEAAVPTETSLTVGSVTAEPLADYQFNDIEFSDYQKSKISALSLANKRMVNFGDSIAYGASGTSYAEQIADKNYMLWDNKAVGGATIRVTSDNTNNVLAQIEGYTPTYTPDFVLVNGLTNDASDTTIVSDATLLGEISDGFAAELDTSTFCGAFETILKTLITKYLGAKIIYVTTHINNGRDYTTQKSLTDLAVQMCQKWGVAVADMFHEGELNSFIEAQRTAYISDGSHPNTLGYQKFYVPLVENKMRGLAT